MSVPRQMLRCCEAAVVCGVSERTIHNWIRRGRLAAIKMAGSVRIEREALERFIAGEQCQADSVVGEQY